MILASPPDQNLGGFFLERKEMDDILIWSIFTLVMAFFIFTICLGAGVFDNDKGTDDKDTGVDEEG
jgi:hypothetical protein